MAKVAVVMGSLSDLDAVRPCIDILKKFDVEVVARVISAHRTPDTAHEFASSAEKEGIEVLICAAGKAAHLGGVMAAFTPLPVIGLPIKSSTMDGLDSLLSMVQMPAGIPVATVAIDGAQNAALLAVQILAVSEPSLADKLLDARRAATEKVLKKDAEIAAKYNK